MAKDRLEGDNYDTGDGEGMSPSEFIRNASKIKENKQMQELIEKQRKQKEIIDNKIKRKLRNKLENENKQRKIKTIEDALKKGQKIRWELVGTNKLKGFVKDKLVFEIKKGMTIYNLYILENSLIVEGIEKGYLSCSSNVNKLKDKAEKIIRQ